MSEATNDRSRVRESWTANGLYFEYSKAANPIAAGYTTRVPLADFPHRLHEEGPTGIIPFDLSEQLKCPGPATSPALCANFIRINPGEKITTKPNATSELYHVIRGLGATRVRGQDIPWEMGDFFVLPAGCEAIHHARDDAAFYWVHDEPLLHYLGAKATEPRFRPTLYPRDRVRAELHKVEQDPAAQKRSRVSVLLANKVFDQTRTITHVLWAMFGVLPANTSRHSFWRTSMTHNFKVGDHVEWNSEAGRVQGTIKKRITSEIEFKGHKVHASKKEPQYMIKSDKTDHIAMHKGAALTKISRSTN